MQLRRWLLAVALAFVTTGAGGALAQDEEAEKFDVSGAYIGIRGIGSFGEMHDVDNQGFMGRQNTENDTDEVAGVAGVVGWTFYNFPARVELEFGHRFRFDLDVRDQQTFTTIDYEVDVATWQAMVNAILEWRNSSSFTPFVGLTGGWARHEASTQRSNLGTGLQTKNNQTTDNLAIGGLLGVNWRFVENFSVEFMYRYIDMGQVSTGTLTTRDKVESDNYTSHDLLFSAYYHF